MSYTTKKKIFFMKRLLLFFSLIFLSFLSFLSFAPLVFAKDSSPKKELLTGWYSWDPYQFEEVINAQRQVTGLDVALVKSIIKEAGFNLIFEERFWKEQQDDLRAGKRDFSMGATKTKEREAFVYFTKPYRFEENSLFVLRGEEALFDSSSVDNFLKSIVKKNLKISVINGFIYADPKINKWIKDPKNEPYILKVPTDQGSIEALLAGKVQGFLADRLVGATMIWRHELGGQLNEVPLPLKTPIHLMFSKKITTPETIKKINAAIDKVRETNQYQEIIRSYLYPVLLLQTASAWWFQLIEILGIFAFAISGLLIAYRQNATLFGAFLFALLPSLGGGIVRDVIFQRDPIGLLRTPIYLSIVILTVLGGTFIIRILHKRKNKDKLEKQPFSLTSRATTFLMVTDALGLASFTVTGVIVSVLAKAEPLWLWGGFFAFLTSAGGSIMRDLLSESRDIIALNGALYAEIAMIWGTLLSLFLIYQSDSVSAKPITYAVIVTIIGAFVTRLLCYFLKVPNIRLKKV